MVVRCGHRGLPHLTLVELSVAGDTEDPWRVQFLEAEADCKTGGEAQTQTEGAARGLDARCATADVAVQAADTTIGVEGVSINESSKRQGGI